MIHLFRIIRQQLLLNSKFTKYILYAIGEIALVVIGILIALAVNNRNNQRLNNLRVERFVERLQIQLEENLSDVNDYIETNTEFYGESMELLSIIGDSKDVDNESNIDLLILYNAFDYQLNLDMNVIMESRENGDLALISNDSLSQSIYNFVTYYNKILEDERIMNSNLNNHFSPYLTKNYNLKNLLHRISDEEGLSQSRIYAGDNYKMLMDQEFENLITLRLIHTKELLDSYIDLKEDILEIYKFL